jgi:hypothetical protein
MPAADPVAIAGEISWISLSLKSTRVRPDFSNRRCFGSRPVVAARIRAGTI